MSLGIAGANLWIPIFALVFSLEPQLAFWVALVTMASGTLSGALRNAMAKTVAWDTVRGLAPIVAAGAAAGAVLSRFVDPELTLGAFAVFAAGNGLWMLLRRPDDKPVAGLKWVGLVAGTLHGVIATGCGVLLMRPLTQRAERAEQPAAIGAAVVLVFVASVVAALARLDAEMRAALVQVQPQLVPLLAFVVPGVVIGGQLGPRLAQRIAGPRLRPYAGVVLLVVAGLLIVRLVA